MHLRVVSIGLFIVPLLLGLLYDVSWHALLVGIVIFTSILYHCTQEKRYAQIDQISSLLLMSGNIVLCILFGFRQQFFMPIIILAGIAMLV